MKPMNSITQFEGTDLPASPPCEVLFQLGEGVPKLPLISKIGQLPQYSTLLFTKLFHGGLSPLLLTVLTTGRSWPGLSMLTRPVNAASGRTTRSQWLLPALWKARYNSATAAPVSASSNTMTLKEAGLYGPREGVIRPFSIREKQTPQWLSRPGAGSNGVYPEPTHGALAQLPLRRYYYAA